MNIFYRQRFVLAGLCCAIFLSACAQSAYHRLYPIKSEMVWPPKPAQARIRYLGSFQRPEEMGIEKGFLSRLGDLFAGAEERHMVRPMAVVSMSEQEIYVADPGARGVHYFNRKRNEYRLIQQADNQPLPSPVGLARGPNHSVLVADSELGGIFIIQPGGDTASPLVLDVRLAQPTGIARDQATGRMYVTDTAGHSFSIFDQHGKRLKQIGKRGNGKAEFNFPTLMWLDKERLYVTDSLNFRIQMFDHDGVFKGFFGQIGTTTGTLSRPKGVATDNFGHIYTVDSLFHALQIFNDQGQLLLNIGRQGGLPGEFWLPTGLYISENNTIYIADSHNRRVQVFQYIGGKS